MLLIPQQLHFGTDITNMGKACTADFGMVRRNNHTLGPLNHHPVNGRFFRMEGRDAAFGADAVHRQNGPPGLIPAQLLFRIDSIGEAILRVDLSAQQQHMNHRKLSQLHGHRQRVGHYIEIPPVFQRHRQTVGSGTGVEKQRTAIARMLTQKTPIMVFDDSLSAVDAETDARIRQELRKNLGDSTVILIAHRVTTLMQADCILVLDKGEITEIGTHEQLMEKKGIYHKIYNMQMSLAEQEEE